MPAPRTKSQTPTLEGPLRVATFRNLLLANLASDIGTFMQSVGAAWLMVSFGRGGGPEGASPDLCLARERHLKEPD